jgi:hypothetical protein
MSTKLILKKQMNNTKRNLIEKYFFPCGFTHTHTHTHPIQSLKIAVHMEENTLKQGKRGICLCKSQMVKSTGKARLDWMTPDYSLHLC